MLHTKFSAYKFHKEDKYDKYRSSDELSLVNMFSSNVKEERNGVSKRLSRCCSYIYIFRKSWEINEVNKFNILINKKLYS